MHQEIFASNEINVKIMEYVKINRMEVIHVYVPLVGKDVIVMKVS
jgi:hypothetical protein